MTRISLLLWLFLPTVLSSSLFNKEENKAGCGKGHEFMCLVRENCVSSVTDTNMQLMREGDNYEPAGCDIHVRIKQYNTSSYWIRSITKSTTFKLMKDATYFGCQSNNGKLSVIKSPDSIILNLIPTKQPDGKTEKGMSCEFTVTFTNGEEIFQKEKDMFIDYKDATGKEEKLTIKSYRIQDMNEQIKVAKYRCGLINPGGSNFAESGAYNVKPIVYHNGQKASCPTREYVMAFEENSEIKQADSIHCEMVEENGCQKANPPTCRWQFTLRQMGQSKRVPAPADFNAACRWKSCKMCSAPKLTCTGNDKCPVFSATGGCDTLMCPEDKHKNDKQLNYVSVNGGNTTMGKFECNPGAEKGETPHWTFVEGETGKTGINVTTAVCHDGVECEAYNPLKCIEEPCPTPIRNGGPFALNCTEGFELKLTDTSDESTPNVIKPSSLKCDRQKGIYQYVEEGSENTVAVDNAKMEVACAKIGTVPTKAGGMPAWQLIVIIIVGTLVLVVLVVLSIFCFRRSKKKDEEKRALLKKADSAPSSNTESNKPKDAHAMVHMQPCSTARQISSEQISEGTAKAPTPAEKTMIAPTPTIQDLKTAFSHEKSRASKRETGSIEAEYIDGASNRHKQQSAEKTSAPVFEESAPSAKQTVASKKEVKEAPKDDSKKPRKFELNEKEKLIAKGKYRRNEDYPTMADIESDWDDEKDGKPPSKQPRTKDIPTKDIPTADTPSTRAKGAELNEKTAEMERLLDQPQLKLQRASSEEMNKQQNSLGSLDNSNVSVRKTNNKFSTLMTDLDLTQDQQK